MGLFSGFKRIGQAEGMANPAREHLHVTLKLVAKAEQREPFPEEADSQVYWGIVYALCGEIAVYVGGSNGSTLHDSLMYGTFKQIMNASTANEVTNVAKSLADPKNQTPAFAKGLRSGNEAATALLSENDPAKFRSILMKAMSRSS